MATSTQTGLIQYPCTTAAEFCAAGRKMRDAFDAVGFTKTADTGQVDFNADAATSGYEIRTLGDTYVRIDYGISGGFWGDWTVGTSSNGSGTLTGTTASPAVDFPGTTSTSYIGTEGKSLRVSSDGETYLFAYISNAGASFALPSVLLASSSSGVSGHPYIALGEVTAGNNIAVPMDTTYAYRLGGSPTGSIGGLSLVPPVVHSGANNETWGSSDPADIEVYVSKHRWSRSHAWTDFLPVIHVWAGEIPDDSPFVVNINGTNRTYITNSKFYYNSAFRRAFLWE